ncbi:MAG: type II toxin-antitoxin system RelE/ParE family toxin [Candidatus Omnitrophica bacterium]|nr:type II toxin-antitoxin system RelE/ParE family toxin [Candidatus Omnitrophota bacterium]MBU1997250.1 type II toxin-antitoxin system RelE/ParE family toxin [Candidatus Omnitrophota bacterium]MBU4333498.1 type II toxin-antitoxin system RelE/ParE family toxin [Candidatus Omnitrophota bacterium]
MEKYRVEIKRSAVKELKKIPKKDLKVIIEKIGLLSQYPRPKESKKLSDDERYRLCNGKYRFLYYVEDAVVIIFVVKIPQRKDIYKQ